jgi:hypothetical protein
MNHHQQRPARKASAVIALVFGLVFPTILHTGLYVDVAVACFVLIPVFLFGRRERTTFSLVACAILLHTAAFPGIIPAVFSGRHPSHEIRVLSRIMPVRR